MSIKSDKAYIHINGCDYELASVVLEGSSLHTDLASRLEARGEGGADPAIQQFDVMIGGRRVALRVRPSSLWASGVIPGGQP